MTLLCRCGSTDKPVAFEGCVKAEDYAVRCWDCTEDVQPVVETLLETLIESLSTAQDNSDVAKFNAHDCSDFALNSPAFAQLLLESKVAHEKTAGVFDPTVLPLWEAWQHSRTSTDGAASDLYAKHDCIVGYDHVVVGPHRAKKLREGVRLSLDALRHGYAADKVLEQLKSSHVRAARVTVKNSVVTCSIPPVKRLHKIDLTPLLHLSEHTATPPTYCVEMDSQALAVQTQHCKSPSYYVDPFTRRVSLGKLSAVVAFSNRCTLANAYATAAMIKGISFANTLVQTQGDVAFLFFYVDAEGNIQHQASQNLSLRPTKDGWIVRWIDAAAQT